MQFRIDPPARHIIVACAVTLPSGPDRLAPMLAQLEKIKEEPEIGTPCRKEPVLTGCRLLLGDRDVEGEPIEPTVVYRLDPETERIELLAMQREPSQAPAAAVRVRRLAEARGERALTAGAVCSSLVKEHTKEIRPAVPKGSPVPLLRDAVLNRVYSMGQRHAPTAPFEFPFRVLTGLGLWLNELQLGIAIGAAYPVGMEALRRRGDDELAMVSQLTEQFPGQDY